MGHTQNKTERNKVAARKLLGLFLLAAGFGHLTWARVEFNAQVPNWVPLNKDLTVVLSGVAEIVLGGSLVFLNKRKITVGWVVATFFVVVFPGNIAQLLNHKDAFGLNSGLARGIRILFQPVLIIVALWSTGAWQAYRDKKKLKI